MTATQIWRVIYARRHMIIALTVTIVAIVAGISLLMPKKYRAELAIVVDIKGSSPLNDAALAPQLVPSYLTTQAQIIESRNVALKVIDELALMRDPELLAKWQRGGGAGDMHEWLVNVLLDDLDTKTFRDSSIIRISYSHKDPQAAARFANAFAQAYVQTSLELQVDPARRQAQWFGQQVDQLRSDLTAAQTKLSNYQRDHGVLGVDDARIDVENARMQEISNHLVAVQSTMYDAQTRRDQVAGNDGNRQDQSPDLMKDPVLQALKGEVARAEAKVAELSERYDRNHPLYKSAAAEAAALRDKFNTEAANARASLTQSAEIARRQVQEVQSALEDQKNRIIALKRQRDELSVLSRDVESARAAYDAALKQANQTRLESRVDRTNIAVLNPATPPLSAATPRTTLNIAVALVVGLMLSIALALGLELMTRRIRSREELAEAMGLPVLAEICALPVTRRGLSIPKAS
jgi:chain length determinant protein EpsF